MRRLNASTIIPVSLSALLVAAGLAGCDEADRTARYGNFGGNAESGARQISETGCGACHMIPGIPGAKGLVGPPLSQMGDRVYIAGLLRNTPPNMIAWLRDPQRFVPGNAMPDMDLSEQEARDIAAYLFQLR